MKVHPRQAAARHAVAGAKPNKTGVATDRQRLSVSHGLRGARLEIPLPWLTLQRPSARGRPSATRAAAPWAWQAPPGAGLDKNASRWSINTLELQPAMGRVEKGVKEKERAARATRHGPLATRPKKASSCSFRPSDVMRGSRCDAMRRIKCGSPRLV